MTEREDNVQHFLDLIQKSRIGKFKIYIGMSAGVGKTYRMLQEAHALLRSGIDVKIGYIETHNRKETQVLLEGLPLIPRRTIFYKGKELEEMDVQAVINLRPEVVIVDELAHTNMEGSKNEKRWQDVLEILEAGINVISAVNIQHIESLNEEVKKITMTTKPNRRSPVGFWQSHYTTLDKQKSLTYKHAMRLRRDTCVFVTMSYSSKLHR